MAEKVMRYILIYTGLYLGLSAIEVFVLSPLVDFAGNEFWNRFIVYAVLLIVINPLIVKLIGNFVFRKEDVSQGDRI